MNTIAAENLCYCPSCGAANKKSAVACAECEKKLNKKGSAFYDYLLNHVKGEIKDRVTDSVFSALKNYLLSHLYGVALSVTVLAVGASVVYTASAPHVENVKAKPQAVIAENAETKHPEAEVENAITDWDEAYFMHILSIYDNYVYSHSYGETYSDEKSLSDLWAETAIPGYNYPAAHEAYTDAIPVGAYLESAHVSMYSLYEPSTFLKNENVTTALAKQLYADGYEVAEGTYTRCAHGAEVTYDNPPANPDEQVNYYFVFVKYGDAWYIAEDRRI